MSTLDEFESRLQTLLEVQLLKYLPGYRVEDGIAQRLAAAMHSHLKEEASSTWAPNLFVIIANPSTLDRWDFKQKPLQELSDALYSAGKEAGFKFTLKPAISATSDVSLPSNEVRVIASFSNESLSETQGAPVESTTDADGSGIPSNAFLIVNGNQVIPISRPVMNIGRRLDNHVVIDDPRVSRAHAQLRVIKDHYVLFDLNSSGGTFINGQRCRQVVLNAGDVISLAGVTLIFGQDLPAGGGSTEGETEPNLHLSRNQGSSSMVDIDGADE